MKNITPNDPDSTHAIDTIRLKYPSVAEKVEETLTWLFTRSWSEEIEFIILFGSVAAGTSRSDSDVDLALGIRGTRDFHIIISKEIILNKPYEEVDIRIFDILPIYIQKDVLKGVIVYSRDLVRLHDIAYDIIKRFEHFKPYLDDYLGVKLLS